MLRGILSLTGMTPLTILAIYYIQTFLHLFSRLIFQKKKLHIMVVSETAIQTVTGDKGGLNYISSFPPVDSRIYMNKTKKGKVRARGSPADLFTTSVKSVF